MHHVATNHMTNTRLRNFRSSARRRSKVAHRHGKQTTRILTTCTFRQLRRNRTFYKKTVYESRDNQHIITLFRNVGKMTSRTHVPRRTRTPEWDRHTCCVPVVQRNNSERLLVDWDRGAQSLGGECCTKFKQPEGRSAASWR